LSSFLKTTLVCLILSQILAQPENRFNPFDWVQYRSIGSINSLSSDNRYLYFGTQDGGVGRYLLFGHRFDEPITRAQGLNSNTITALHVAFGTLWVATRQGLNYSYTREGDWHFISRDRIGLPAYTLIDRIGNSKNYLWLVTPSMYYKCDRSTGIVVSVMPVPDEKNIKWSSGILEFVQNPADIVSDYVPLNGWIQQGNTLVSPYGKTVSVTTLFRDFYGDLWIGTSDGTLFYGDQSMKTLTPLFFGLSGNDIQAIGKDGSFWLAGRFGAENTGISYVDPRRDIYDRFEYAETINMDPISIYSILPFKNEVWFGGQGTLLLYNRKKDYWRTLGVDRGFPEGTYHAMAVTDQYVWIGSSQGLFRIDRKTKRHQPGEIETVFTNRFIYDLLVDQNRLWIASESGLFIYNTDSKILVDYRKYGKSNPDSLPVNFTDFTSLEKSDSIIYAASEGGIFSFNLHSWTWSKAVDPAIFGGKLIRAMVVNGSELFLSGREGLLRYDLKHQIIKNYNYPFIGEINDMYISRGRIWLGTTEGLISFAWKRD
jgi:ligand-binding sensor domain-containing protein